MSHRVETGRTADYFARDRTEFLEFVGGPTGRVLDVGCGSGANAAWYRSAGASEIVGVEISPAAAEAAAATYDRVINLPIEAALPGLEGPFDLIVCADVLEHLVDPWTVLRGLLPLASARTRLAASLPNIRHVPALVRIAVGRGFEYEEEGIFDSTHLRFFTRGNMHDLLETSGWRPSRWGAPRYQRAVRLRSALERATAGRANDWLSRQLYVIAAPAPGRRSFEPGLLSLREEPR